MSGSRTFIINAGKIESSLQHASKQKDCRESIKILEQLMTDPAIQKIMSQPGSLQTKLQTNYNDMIRALATELYQVSHYIAGQLDELDNVKTDHDSPKSHTNASIAFTNLSHYLVDDILTAPNTATRILALKRWLKILDISMKLGDFHSVAAIHAGLNDAALGRLKTIFIHLSDDERKQMESINDTFLFDQGWKLMSERLESSDRNYFIPSLAGIKKAITKAKEAKQAHSMHSDFLTSQGKLNTSSSTHHASGSASDSPSKKPTLELLSNLIAHLKASSKLQDVDGLTQLQRDLLALNRDQSDIAVKPITHDEQACYALASAIEREEIPIILNTLQAELHKTLSLLVTQKKLPEPLKTLKKKLRDFPMDSILTARFGSSEHCQTLRTILQELDLQPKATRTPRLLRSTTKSKITVASEENPHPDIQSIITKANLIDEFTKRYDRLSRESTASSASLLGAASSASLAASAAVTSTASDSLSLTSHSSSAADISFTATDTDADNRPATPSLHKKDAATERKSLTHHRSMSLLSSRKSSPATLRDGSPQGSPGQGKHKK